jgi:predicted metal-dependent hydrolase
MTIQFTLKRSRKRKKTLSLQIGPNSEITVYAPYFTPLAEIDRFIAEKQDWIDKTIRNHCADDRLSRAKAYTNGELFYYLGRAYPLEAYFDPLENQGVTFWNGRFFLNSPDNRAIRRHYFEHWYKKKASDYLPARVEHFSRHLNLTPSGLRITKASGRWGSCSPTNTLAFCFRLMMAPPEIIDYVIVHELMHILEKNHSSKFWRLVIEAMPRCQAHKRWLRDHAHWFEL